MREERGTALAGLLLAVAVAAVLSQMALPAIWRIYQQGAVRFEAEHLLSEIRYQQMLARTASGELGAEGNNKYASDRPRLKVDGDGYVLYRGNQRGEKHSCLPAVHMQFSGNWDGKDQFLYFGVNGNVYPGITVLIFASGNDKVICHLVIDTAGRVRLERSST